MNCYLQRVQSSRDPLAHINWEVVHEAVLELVDSNPEEMDATEVESGLLIETITPIPSDIATLMGLHCLAGGEYTNPN